MSRQFLLMGLPNTGKTSFLAALWYLVQHPQVECRFRLDKLNGEDRYLNQISQSWVDYTPVPHTRIDSEATVSMALEDIKSGEKLTLVFPDLSGESFRLQWTDRQFTNGYDKLLQGSAGVMLFINPNEIIKPIRIDMAEPLIKEMPESDVPAKESATMPIWDAEKSPTQVQLVELLQILCSREYFKAPLRLAIIISAWDVLVRLEHSPTDWLVQKLPLLHQYLQSNFPTIETAVFGVSAQGGDYAVTEQNDALQSKRPSERIQVVGKSVTNQHD